MEDWYQHQEFFSETKLQKIKNWMAQELIDLNSYEQIATQLKAAG
ncbi:MAG: hypothetical protein ACPGSG_00285 [Prolixibacteraceae bacterium]